jgi:hypothetical protein
VKALIAIAVILYLLAAWHDRRVEQDERWNMFNPPHKVRKPRD